MHTSLSEKDIKHNWLARQKRLVLEYEQVKAGVHPRFHFLQDFYTANGMKRQNFWKYYTRFKATGVDTALLPAKRGPKWKEHLVHPMIEQKVLEARLKGFGRYEITRTLTVSLGKYAPNPSKVYHILKRRGMNRLTPAMKEHKRIYVKAHAGEMGHMDCHYLPKGLVANMERLYAVGLIDDATRIAWVEIVPEITALTVMFATMRAFSFFREAHHISFTTILSDNGSEFRGKEETHPFERLLKEMGIVHRHTRPMRPQTNGKIERFWRTLDTDVFEGCTFDSVEELDAEIKQYLWYYNTERPHASLGNISPVEQFTKLSSN